MSYRRAWLLVESLKQSFREPVTVASTGGKDGGGMLVTEFGDALIKNYRELERDFATLAARRLQAIIARLSLIPSATLGYRYARSLTKAANGMTRFMLSEHIFAARRSYPCHASQYSIVRRRREIGHLSSQPQVAIDSRVKFNHSCRSVRSCWLTQIHFA